MSVGAGGGTAGSSAQEVVGLRFLRRTGRLLDYAVLMAGMAFCWLSVTVDSPYLNPWAQAHGLSPAQAGAVFSVQPFAVVFAQVLIPCLGRKLGHGRLLTAGFCLSSTAELVFALMPSTLAGLGGHALFAGLVSAALVAGLGEGVVETCTYTLLQEVFPDVVGQVTGHTEAWIGAGIIFGPVLGGSLYSLAGFSLPPAVAAAALLALAAVSWAWSARRRRRARDPQTRGVPATALLQEHAEGWAAGAVAPQPSSEAEEDVPYRRDLAVFAFTLGGVFTSGFQAGCLAPLMSDYWVNDLKWPSSTVGLIIGVWGVVYMVVSVLSGILTDRGPRSARVVFSVGSLSAAAGLFVIGQTELPPALSLCGVLLVAVADAFLVVPGLSLLRQSSPKRDGSFAATLLNALYAFGLGVGPLLAVPLSKGVGLRAATEWIAAALAAFGLALAAVMAARPCPAPPCGQDHALGHPQDGR